MSRFGGRYSVEATLGEGSFGAVYRARDEQLERLVAIKVLRAEAESEEVRGRFAREARLAAAVKHPHVVRLLDYGRTDDDAPFLVFEFVEGSTLEDQLARPVDPEQWTRWVRDVASGLAALHEAGVVHRDVKPANVLVHADGRAMLTDLGLARVEGATFDGLTATGMLVGTPLYMAPELFQAGGEAGPASDLFALGCLAYRGLYGEDWRRPGTYAALLRGEVEELAKVPAGRFGRYPGCDPWLKALLHVDPAQRLGPAVQAVEAIEASPVEGGGGTRSMAVSVVRTPVEDPPEASGRRGWLAAGLAVVVGLVVGLGSDRDAEVPAPQAPPVVNTEAVAAAKDAVRARARALPRIDYEGRSEDEAKRLYRETELDYRAPLKFRRFLQAVRELMAMGYLPDRPDDGFWYDDVYRSTRGFLADVSDVGLPRIAGTILEVSKLEADQSFRDKMTAIQEETRSYAIEYAAAAARAGRMGRHWREDLFHLALSKNEANEYGERLAASLLVGLEGREAPPWRWHLLRSLAVLIRIPSRFGLDLPRAEEIAARVSEVAGAWLEPGAAPGAAPLGRWELAYLVAAEQFLRHRRAVRGTPDPEADLRMERLVDLTLARASEEDRLAGVLDYILDGFEDRVGIPKGSELDEAQMAGVWAMKERLDALAKGRDERF